MPDVNAGADFATRLVSNIYGLHKQKQDEQKADAENSRQTMLKILESAANSGSVNPEDMPTLYGKLFELTGAKSKDVEAVTQHVQDLFSHPSVARSASFDHQTVMPSLSTDTGMPGEAPVVTPGFQLPPVPTTTTENTPAIRLMSPEERARQAGAAQAAQLQASYGQRQKEADDAAQRKLELQGAALTAKERAKLAEITLKGGVDAQKKFNERVNMFLPTVGYDSEAARGLASKSLIRDEDAAAGAKEAQAKVNAARVQYLGGQLAVHQKNADTLSRRVDILAKSLEETARHHRADEAAAGGKGGAVGRNLKVLMANTKELYTALTPLNNAIVKLETDPANKENGELIPEIATQVADLKARRDSIQTKLDTARQTWLPSMPEPISGNGVTTEVPQIGVSRPNGPASDGKHHYTMAQIQATIDPKTGRSKSGKRLEEILSALQGRTDVVIDQ